MPEDVLPCGHLEIDPCVGDETVLLDHWVDRLHPAVPEVYPGDEEKKGKRLAEMDLGEDRSNDFGSLVLW